MPTQENEVKKEALFTVSLAGGKEVPIFEHAITKGISAAAGKTFLAPDLDSVKTIDDILNLFPVEILENVLVPALRRFSINLSREAFTELNDKDEEVEITDPQKIADNFTKLYQIASATGESRASLTERRDELAKEMVKLSGLLSDPTKMQEFMSVAQRFATLEKAIEDKKAERAAKKAAQPAATA